jgi:hypothetical protein
MYAISGGQSLVKGKEIVMSRRKEGRDEEER